MCKYCAWSPRISPRCALSDAVQCLAVAVVGILQGPGPGVRPLEPRGKVRKRTVPSGSNLATRIMPLQDREPEALHVTEHTHLTTDEDTGAQRGHAASSAPAAAMGRASAGMRWPSPTTRPTTRPQGLASQWGEPRSAAHGHWVRGRAGQNLLEPLSLKRHVVMCVIPLENIGLIFQNDLYIFRSRELIFNWKTQNTQKAHHVYSSEIHVARLLTRSRAEGRRARYHCVAQLVTLCVHTCMAILPCKRMSRPMCKC